MQFVHHFNHVCRTEYTPNLVNLSNQFVHIFIDIVDNWNHVSETDAFYILTLYADGVYSVQSFDDDELPVDNILAFITYDDAHRYKTFLESVTNMSTRVECVPRIALDISYYHTMVVDEGAIIFPPPRRGGYRWEKRNA